MIKGAWIRRSTTTADFIPLVSDIDLTVLIDLKDLPALMKERYFYPRHLVRDVQLLAVPFLEDWLETGGIRNRQISSWQTIIPGEFHLRLPASFQKSDLAFELAHESFLLFSQLSQKINEKNFPAQLKLRLELERLLQYWKTGDADLLLVSRSKISPEAANDEMGSFLIRLEAFWGELLLHLEKPMDAYPLTELMKLPDAEITSLFLKIQNRNAILAKDPRSYLKVAEEYPDHFIVTSNFVRLLKGVGVQEQTLLNQVAKRKTPYYVRYNRQRLAHDLIETLLQDIDNESRLYYCFRNNQEFLDSFGWGSAPHWEDLRTGPEGKIPWTREELLRISLANLEVLTRVG